MTKKLIYCLIGSIILIGCSKKTAPSVSYTERYKEDLSVLRPKYEKQDLVTESEPVEQDNSYINLKPKYDVTGKLNTILDSIDILRKDIRYIDGFTIQVYSGTKSEDARMAKGKVHSILPESNPVLKYDEPSFKVKVGKYYSRIEAQKTYTQLMQEFPSAIIIPERIYIQ